MQLLLRRWNFSSACTIGDLFIDGNWECYTLEDHDAYLENGGIKEQGKTAIPRGKYEVIRDLSVRFNKIMPRILGVPQFTGIRIHSGNTAADTNGCILVGRRVSKNFDAVLESRLAFTALDDKLMETEESITIEIV